MVKLLTTALSKQYSRYGARQSTKNEERGASLHIAGATALSAGLLISLTSHASVLEKESLTLIFFGAALYVVVHGQDVLACRTARGSVRQRKPKRKASLRDFSKEYVIAQTYLVGSLTLCTAVAFSNPRWTTLVPHTSKSQFVVAAVAFTFAASLNLIDDLLSNSHKKNSPSAVSGQKISKIANVLFLVGSNFQIAGSVLQLKQFSAQCDNARASAVFYGSGSILHVIGALLHRWQLNRGPSKKLARHRGYEESGEEDGLSDSDRNEHWKKSAASKPKAMGMMRWFRRTHNTTEDHDRSLRSMELTDSEQEETDSNSGGSLSSEEEALVRTRGQYRGKKRL